MSGPSEPAGRVVAVVAGHLDDGGFIQCGWEGLRGACERLGYALEPADRVPVAPGPLTEAVRAAAAGGAGLVVVHGGASDVAVETVAPDFPGQRFLSTFGSRAGANFWAWGVKQFESAFLAGAAAGLLTRSGVVGHLSGIRIAPGLAGRAAYAAGLGATRPDARLVTCFCGTQDDNDVSLAAARAEIGEGVDVLFTMLNAGRPGAIAACREAGVVQIGNVRAWHLEMPEVFVGSAIADTGRLIADWLALAKAGRLARGDVRRVGIEQPEVVRMALAERVDAAVHARVEALAARLRAGTIAIPTDYEGPELVLA